MKVWLVGFGWDYEGEHEDAWRVFANEADARAFADDPENLKLAHIRYDYSVVLERGVIS